MLKLLSATSAVALGVLMAVVIAMMASAGCQKVPVNGDLDGQWQLVSLDRDGVVTPGDGRYLRIQLDVAQLARNEWVPREGTGNMEYSGSTLKIDFVNCREDKDVEMLNGWGVYENPAVFHIVELTSERLVLKGRAVVSTWRKF